jgi:Flp pilus assembly pilin Flp
MKLHRFFADETAATAIEYAVIAALIACVLMAGTQLLGVKVANAFWKITFAFPDPPPPVPTQWRL